MYHCVWKARVNLSELINAKMPGKMVSEGVVDVLMRVEENIFVDRMQACAGTTGNFCHSRPLLLPPLPPSALWRNTLLDRDVVCTACGSEVTSKVVFVRIADSAWLVRMGDLFGNSPLAKDDLRKKDEAGTQIGRAKGKGFYNKLISELSLEQPRDKLLVSICVPGNLHFSMGLWLPWTNELFAFDSLRPCGHAAVVQDKFVPFVNHVMRKSNPDTFQPVQVLIKDDQHGVQKQPVVGADVNACGFAAPYFLSKALTLVAELAESKGSDHSIESMAVLLSQGLREMTIDSSAYKNRRRCGKNDLIRLSEEYRRHVRGT